jgi:hypothetical protein
MNLAEALLVRDGDGGLAVTFADHSLPVPQSATAEHPGLERFLDRPAGDRGGAPQLL